MRASPYSTSMPPAGGAKQVLPKPPATRPLPLAHSQDVSRRGCLPANETRCQLRHSVLVQGLQLVH